jgi:benzoate-CoA ligase
MFNAAEYFVDRHILEGRGGDVAIECGDRRITYGDLHESVNRAGSALRELAIRPEERVLLLMLDVPEMIFSFFGAIKIGAVPIPTSTLWTSEDYEFVLRDSRAAAVIVSGELFPRIAGVVPRCPSVRHVIVTGGAAGRGAALDFDALLGRAPQSLEPEDTSEDAPAFWLYSSGSTGKPKACVHLQHDMCVCSETYGRHVLEITSRDRCFSVAKLFFAYGLGNAMYFPFAVGATAVLWPGSVAPANVYEVIERHRPTLFFSVPTHYAMMLAHRRESGEFDLSSIRCAVSAGESLPPAVFSRFRDRFGVEILDGIGSTEVLHIFISNRRGGVRPGSSGVLVPGYNAKIVDERGHQVVTGEIGSLWVKGDSTCALYWNRHELTKRTIQGDWIRTGDHYYQDDDGYYWFAGRSDDMLKVGGIWVSPAELEHALVEHPAVLTCGVTGRPDQDGLIKPMAYIVLREGVQASPQMASDLQQFARGRFADYKRPRWIEFVDALPTTATGKVQRFKLRERAVKESEAAT